MKTLNTLSEVSNSTKTRKPLNSWPYQMNATQI